MPSGNDQPRDWLTAKKVSLIPHRKSDFKLLKSTIHVHKIRFEYNQPSKQLRLSQALVAYLVGYIQSAFQMS